jgi:hypothetical protein
MWSHRPLPEYSEWAVDICTVVEYYIKRGIKRYGVGLRQ